MTSLNNFTPQEELDPEDDFQPIDDFEPIAEENKEVKEDRSVAAKSGRLASQLGIGIISGSPAGLAYDIGTAPIGSKGYQTNANLHRMGEDVEYLYEKNQGKPYEEWSKEDKEFYDTLEQGIQNPQKIYDEASHFDVSIRGLAEKASGVDLHPEGVLEKIANWAGFIKDPKQSSKLIKLGTPPKELIKAIAPYPTELFRSVGAGTALQMAEDGKFGPLGSLGAAIVGDVIGHAPKAINYAARNPKQVAAHAINFLTGSNTQKHIAQQLAEDFAKSNIQVDAGTLTGSPLIQMMQTRLKQSGLVGTALDNMTKELSGQIAKEYENTLAGLGELKFENQYQASEAIKEALKVEEQRLNISTNLKEQAKAAEPLKGRVAVEEKVPYEQNFLERISERETPNTYQGGETLKTSAEDIKTPIKENFDRRWSKFNQRAQNLPGGPQEGLANSLRTFVRDHEGSLLLGESTAESRVVEAANRLLERIMPSEGAYASVNLDTLIKTKRTLADIANWEFGGSNFESSYKNLVGEINNAIDRVLIEHPSLRTTYQHLNADYEAYKSVFENKNVQKLFEPNNYNYNTIYNDFASSPDKLRSLEDIMQLTPRGTEVVNQVKRDYTKKILDKKDLSARDIADLQQVLGPQYDSDVLEFIKQRKSAIEQPLPVAKKGEKLGLEVEKAQQPSASNKELTGRVSETSTKSSGAGVRKKLADKLQGKSSEQIFKQMDTINGIRELKKALSTTPEGVELFKELSRYKLSELIDSKMYDVTKEQVNLGTFSKLLDNQKTKDIVRELVGDAAFERLTLLQKNTGKLSASSAKFYNASKSGTTTIDAAAAGSVMVGLLTMNPYLFLTSAASIGGSYVAANLLADKAFLKELQKAVNTNYGKEFEKVLERMQPMVEKIIAEAGKRQSKEEKEN